jgi:hypothetical protein
MEQVSNLLSNLSDALCNYKAENSLMISFPKQTHERVMKDLKILGRSGVEPLVDGQGEEMCKITYGKFDIYFKEMK